MFETVVVATDGSRHAARAEEAALDFAARFEACLHAVAALTPDAGADREADLRAALEAVAGRADRPVETAVRSGDPPAVVCEYAETVDADAVVVGTRGRGGTYEFHLGSTAEAIVREAPMPVLTIRGAGVEDEDSRADGGRGGAADDDSDGDGDTGTDEHAIPDTARGPGTDSGGA